jgi:transposase
MGAPTKQDWREARRRRAWELHEAGPTPRLTEEQREQLPVLLKQGSEAFGFRGNRWTARLVAVVIASMFGVRYHPDHVRKLLHALGWSPQQPRERASQRNETVIAQWQQQRWSALNKKPKTNEEPCVRSPVNS